jgi:hypothetical protein
VRPTDENQAPSMRPNLMSPKRERTSGEDSILAMLERDPLRKRGTQGAAARLRTACYGAGAVVVLALTGTLVWLAAGNDGLHPEVERGVLAGSNGARQAGRDVAPPAPVVQVALAANAPPAASAAAAASAAPAASAARSGTAAVIVDQRQDGLPPLRMLKPAPHPPERTPAPKPAARAAPAPAPAAAPPARPRPQAIARTAVRPPLKGPRGAAPARPAEAPVDPDVALISAVIVHANGHAPKDSQMTELLCPNDSCQARPKDQ